MERIITINGTGSSGIEYRIRGRREASAYGLSLPYHRKKVFVNMKRKDIFASTCCAVFNR
jgi:hypothetical protein